MGTVVRIALGVAVAAGLALASRQAWACSCGYAELELASPPDGATEVPPDALLWLGVPYGEFGSGPCRDGGTRLRLVDSGGATVPAAESQIDDGARTAIVLTPGAALVPGATYSWSHCEIGEVRTFAVGASVAATAPPVPLLAVSRFTAIEDETSSCEPEYIVALGVQHEGLLFVIDTDGFSAATAGPPTGAVSRLGVGTVTSVGDGNCQTGWEALTRGTSGQIRAGVYGVNGRFSGWSEAVEVTFPELREREGGGEEGCSAAPGRADGPFGLVVLAGWLLVRRWRRWGPSRS